MRNLGHSCTTQVLSSQPNLVITDDYFTGGWSDRTLALSALLLTPWALFQGASDNIIDRIKEEGGDDQDLAESAGNALEMAILGDAKQFIKSPSAQKVIGECR